jgi:hypothetical protein
MLHRSRWFTRGWTLQELLAPTYVIFYDKNWLALGTRPTFAYELHRITSIDEAALGRNPPSLNTFCVARRMSWAAKRTTTREEDMAYSLLGLFDINMPLLYGEGMRAFTRLQEDIIKKSNDDSILAWGLNAVSSTSEPKPTPPMPGLISSTTDSAMQPSPYNTVLAPSPTDFKGCQSLSFNATAGFPFTLTNVGLQVEMLCIPLPSNSDFNDCIAILDCELDSQPDFVGIPLFQSGPDSPGHHTKYIRGVAVTVTPRLAAECSLRQFTIVTERKMVGSIQHVSDRHRVLVTLSEDSQRAGLRIAHGEEVPIEFFSDVSAYTSQWDPRRCSSGPAAAGLRRCCSGSRLTRGTGSPDRRAPCLRARVLPVAWSRRACLLLKRNWGTSIMYWAAGMARQTQSIRTASTGSRIKFNS